MYDVAIIGGGPGGYVAAIKAAQLGGKVFLAEEKELGGTCLNWGCIPTKAMFHSAKLFSQANHGAQYGLVFDNLKLDYGKVASHRSQVVETLVKGVHSLMKANAIDVAKGRASIPAAGKVVVGDEQVEAKNIIIATGSSQGTPPIPGIDSPGVMTTDDILASDQLPQSLLVLGGGVVGVEFASIMSAFGVEVTLVEMLPGLLSTLDSELGRRLSVCMRKSGVDIHVNSKVCSITERDGKLEVEIEGKKGRQHLTVEKVLLAAGRVPNLGGLDLDGLNIDYDRQGIKVDSTMLTNVPGIYAIGDCVPGPMLAHVASHQGIVAAENIMGNKLEMDYRVIPSCVFSLPEVASVGLSEEQAKELGEVQVSKFPFAANGKALAQGATEGMVKMVANQEGTILGVHIIGPQASDLVAEGAVAVQTNMTAAQLAHIIHAHPTLAETVAEAAHGLSGGFIHFQNR